jgi:tetratricopeptide (TPR) repeat protein
MATLDHYSYPHADAEFNLYNFHSQQLVNELAEILMSKDKNSPHEIHLFGNRGSGRHYLLRGAAHVATQRGTSVAIEELSLDGYEPDTPLKKLLEHSTLSTKGPISEKLSELCRRVEVKVTSVNLIFASIGVKSDLTVEEILNFFQQTSQTPGPIMSDRERFKLFLDRLTQRQRVVIYIRDSRAADVALRLHLVDEAKLHPKFFVAFGFLPEDSVTPDRGHSPLCVRIPAWTREEMQRAFAERFQPNEVAEDFFDFAWNSGAATHNREDFAKVVLRLVTNDWLFTNRRDSWSLEPDWQKNALLVEQFSRDLFEPVRRIKLRLEMTSDLSEDQIGKLFDFLDSAALCDPTIPVYPLLDMLGVPAEEMDTFIDQLDGLFGVENSEGILDDLGFQHSGFPPSQLIYRFRNPVLPSAVLNRHAPAELCDLAIRVLNFMRGTFRPDTRTLANLFMRLADAAQLRTEVNQFEKTLSYWTAVEETEALAKAITEDLKLGDVSPEVLWSILALSQDSWPPARRWALLQAYGSQGGGIPFDNRFSYFLTAAKILLDLDRFAEAIEAAQEATGCERPEPKWQSEGALHTVAGLAEKGLGRLGEARNWFEFALRIARANVSPKHPNVAVSLNNLASVLHAEGQYAEARKLFERALAIEEEIFGPQHPSVAVSLNNLASVLHAEGQHAEARKLQERTLAIEEEIFGPKHPNVAASLNNLASVLHAEGQHAEARKLQEQALAIAEEIFGPKHPNVAAALGNLADLLLDERQYAEARKVCERALAILEEFFGPKHPDVATSLNNLASVLHAEGQYAEAHKLCERALTIREEAFGPKHPDVAKSLNNLGSVLRDEGQYAEARRLHERALTIREEAFGSKHPDVATTLSNLAAVLYAEAHYDEARKLYERALAILEEFFGPKHPDVATALSSLAAVLYAEAHYDEARKLLQRAAAIKQEISTPSLGFVS